MQWPRVAFAFVLMFALVLALGVTLSNASGQGYVTITTQITTTAPYPYPLTTIHENVTVSTSVPGNAFGPFSLDVCGIGAQLKQDFYAVANERYHVEWYGSNTPLNVYITPAFNGWIDNVYCDSSGTAPSVGGSTALFSKEVLVSKRGPNGSVDWVAPSTGLFVLWIWNFSPKPVMGTWSLQGVSRSTIISSISYGTTSTIELLALTTTVSQAGLHLGNFGFLGAIAAVVVIAAVLVVARRRKPSAETAVIQKPSTTIHETPIETVPSQMVISTKVTTPQSVILEVPPIISTGYADLDKALSGGIPEEFAVVIVSPSFDERDLLLRKVVNSALSSGRLAVLISNDMGRTKDMASRYPNGFYALSTQADRISPHSPNLLKIPSFENLSDANISLGLVLKDVLAKEKATKRIMILDILSDLLLRYKSVTTRRWLTDFVGKRKAEGFTVIATLNPLTTTKEETQSIIDFFDGVIEIFEKPLTERSRRFLIIKKMYGQKYSDSEVLMDRDKLF